MDENSKINFFCQQKLYQEFSASKYCSQLLQYMNFCLELYRKYIQKNQKLRNSMANFVKRVTEKIAGFDIFSSPVLMRYKQNQSVSSKTGGLISLLILAAMIGTFFKSWTQMLNKSEVKAEYQVTNDVEPTPVFITKQNFFFAFNIRGFNLSNPLQPRFLDFEVRKEKIVNGIPSVQIVQMKKCEKSDITPFGKEYEAIYDKLGISNFLCLPMNFSLQIQGKWTSPTYSYLKLVIKRCNLLNPLCFNEVLMDQFLARNTVFFVNFHFINKIINPSLLEPTTTYYEDRPYLLTNKMLGQDLSVMVAEYIVNTDEALIPIEQMNTTKGLYFQKSDTESVIIQSSNQTFAQFSIKKSGKKIVINRQFTKLDEFLSYIGGLFGIIATVFGFLLMKYNSYCFEISMCQKVFKFDETTFTGEKTKNIDEKNENKPASSTESQQINFNFFIFLKYQIYTTIRAICPKFRWSSMDVLHDQFQQTKNQMNFDTILQKVSFYERSFQCLFDQNQIMLLQLQSKLSIKELKEQRILMNLEKNEFCRTVMLQNLQNNLPFSSLESAKGNQDQNSMDVQKPELKKKNLTTEQNIQEHKTSDLYQAINHIIKKSKQGDAVSKKIYAGIREDILLWHRNYSVKKEQQNQTPDYIPVQFVYDQKCLSKEEPNQIEPKNGKYYS